MANITVEELYRGKNYNIVNAVSAKEKILGIDRQTSQGREWHEMEIIRQTVIAMLELNKNGDCISDKELGDAVAVFVADLIAQKEYPIERELGIVLLTAMQYALEHGSSDASVIIDCIMSFLRHIDITSLQYMRKAVSERTPIEDPKNRWLNEEWKHLGFMIERELRVREVK